MEFAEQFSVDVSSVSDDLRGRFTSALGNAALPAVMLTYFADFLPRVRAGFEALGMPVPWNEMRSSGITTAIWVTCCSTSFSPVSPGWANSTR